MNTTTPSSPRLVSSLWVGDTLPPLAELSIRSFLDHGIAFQLFTYRVYPNVPEGATVRSAREILSESSVYLHSSGSYGMFSDWFRYALLEQEGGWWVDLDVVCLSDNLPGTLPWYACQEPGVCSSGLLAFPPHHPLVTAMRQLAEDPASPMPWDGEGDLLRKENFRTAVPDVRERRRSMSWGHSGPDMLTVAVRHFGLESCGAPAETVYPVPYTCWRSTFNGSLTLDSPGLSRAWALHLWGEMLRREPDAMDTLADHSIVARLMARHGMKRKTRILVGICSCQTARPRRDAVRETWLTAPAPGVTCRFFLGGDVPQDEQADTIGLDTPDTYHSLPAKVLAFFRYALDHYDFDWLFKCDDDTYLRQDRLDSLCREEYGLVGNCLLAQRSSPSGGAGYLMPRHIIEKIVASPDIPATGAEDVIFGQLALELGAVPHATDRLCMDTSAHPLPDNDIVTAHWCSPDMLRRIDYFFREKPVTMYRARHTHWEDTILFYPDGTFSRSKIKDAGQLERHSGSITLNWFGWAPEQLQEREKGYVGSRLLLRPCAGFPTLTECFPLDPGEEKAPLLIQLGCSSNHITGWLNLDLPHFDITRPLPWKDASVDAYFLEHVIEHILPAQAYDFFREVRRTLRPGGILRLAFPDILRIAASATPAYCEFLRSYGWGDGTPGSAVRAIIQCHGHKAIWTQAAMTAVLESLGFTVDCFEPGASSTPHLYGLERHGELVGQEINRVETACLEARIPLGQAPMPDQH